MKNYENGNQAGFPDFNGFTLHMIFAILSKMANLETLKKTLRSADRTKKFFMAVRRSLLLYLKYFRKKQPFPGRLRKPLETKFLRFLGIEPTIKSMAEVYLKVFLNFGRFLLEKLRIFIFQVVVPFKSSLTYHKVLKYTSKISSEG